MSPKSRADNRAEMEAGILRAGREQLAERGAAGLSLREVARSLGVVSSAVYRYVSSRDELLTLLLVDAYTALADHVDAALGAQDTEATGRARLTTLAHAMRQWALEHPALWGLVYGAPVPGYAAPQERTTPPGTRVLARLAELAPALRMPEPGRALSAPLETYLRGGVTHLGLEVTAEEAARGLTLWSCLVGTISAEVFGQLGPGTGELGAELLERTLDTLAGPR